MNELRSAGLRESDSERRVQRGLELQTRAVSASALTSIAAQALPVRPFVLDDAQLANDKIIRFQGAETCPLDRKTTKCEAANRERAEWRRRSPLSP